MRVLKWLSIFIICFNSSVIFATAYRLPEQGSRLLGEATIHQVKKGDYFQQLAEQYNVGFLALMAANPGIDPFLPSPGAELKIPNKLLLPYVERKGIVINLPELRLYYFHPDNSQVTVFPVGVGRFDLPTPRTTSYIGEKKQNPIWRPSEEMKERYLKEKGIKLTDEVLPGANNPFGQYALRLGTSEYLIHGSNKRFGIGMRSSSGCLRLYDDDIKWLYDNVPLNTQVKIIDQPVKMSYESNGERLIEFHQPLTDEDGKAVKLSKTEVIQTFVGNRKDRWQALESEISVPSGLVIKLLP